MRRDDRIRRAIDESLSGVHFNAHDERSVLRAIRSREADVQEETPERRRFRPGFAFALTLLLVAAAPLSLTLLQGSGTRGIVAARPDAVATARPDAQSDPIVQTSAESAVIAAARTCFEAVCDTSIFSFEEYAVSVSPVEMPGSNARYEVTLRCVYDNGCSFTAVVDYPSCEVIQHSTPALATVPTFFDEASDEVQSWYVRYGPYPFTWDMAAQAEFSRRYEGASLRESHAGELTPEQARETARKAAADHGLPVPVFAYPTLLSERASEDGQARYAVYCFAREVSDELSDPCAVVTLRAQDGYVESVETLSAMELQGLL